LKQGINKSQRRLCGGGGGGPNEKTKIINAGGIFLLGENIGTTAVHV
jgi:hypothetical protein